MIILEPEQPLFNGLKLGENYIDLEFNIHLNKDPDIFKYHFVLGETKYAIKKLLIKFNRFGIHHPDGVFIGFGSQFKHIKLKDPLSIADVSPIILYLNELPIGSDMDGKVPMEIFHKEYIFKDIIKSYDNIVPPELETGEINEDKIKEKLKDLGYIE